MQQMRKSRKQFRRLIAPPQPDPHRPVERRGFWQRRSMGWEAALPRGRVVRWFSKYDQVPPPYCICHGAIFTPGMVAGQIFTPGFEAGQILNQPECCE